MLDTLNSLQEMVHLTRRIRQGLLLISSDLYFETLLEKACFNLNLPLNVVLLSEIRLFVKLGLAKCPLKTALQKDGILYLQDLTLADDPKVISYLVETLSGKPVVGMISDTSLLSPKLVTLFGLNLTLPLFASFEDRIKILSELLPYELPQDKILTLVQKTMGYHLSRLAFLFKYSLESSGQQVGLDSPGKELELENAMASLSLHKEQEQHGYFKRLVKVLDDQNSDPTRAQSPYKLCTFNTVWDNIIGYSGIKSRLQQFISMHMIPSETHARLGAKLPSGLLLYGPSGVGKSLLIQALIHHSKMNAIQVDLKNVYSKYLGSSEAYIRGLFATASALSPCIIYFDHFEAMGSKRGSQVESGVNSRVLSTLLNELDGIVERNRVFLIASTCSPWDLDDALLRPGRLDDCLYIPPPSLGDRLELLNTLLSPVEHCISSKELTEMASVSDGFLPCDLMVLVRESCILSKRSNSVLSYDHLLESLAKTSGPYPEWILSETRDSDLIRYQSFSQ